MSGKTNQQASLKECRKRNGFVTPPPFIGLADQLGAASATSFYCGGKNSLRTVSFSLGGEKKNGGAERLSVPWHVIFYHAAKEQLFLHGLHVSTVVSAFLTCGRTAHTSQEFMGLYACTASCASQKHSRHQARALWDTVTGKHKVAFFKYCGKEIFRSLQPFPGP